MYASVRPLHEDKTSIYVCSKSCAETSLPPANFVYFYSLFLHSDTKLSNKVTPLLDPVTKRKHRHFLPSSVGSDFAPSCSLCVFFLSLSPLQTQNIERPDTKRKHRQTLCSLLDSVGKRHRYTFQVFRYFWRRQEEANNKLFSIFVFSTFDPVTSRKAIDMQLFLLLVKGLQKLS
jgi:hypothetical protein